MTSALPVFTERDFYRRPRKVRSDKGKKRGPYQRRTLNDRRTLPQVRTWCTNPPRHTDPDFVPSLRLLVCREQYSLADIGMMFGVTRERARQWCVKYNIEYPDGGAKGSRGLFAVRVWDDAANRFTPVRSSAIRAVRKNAERARIAELREARRQRRRAAVIASAVRLKAELGRDPTALEIATAVRGGTRQPKAAAMYLVHLWDSSRKPTAERYRALRAALAAVGVNARGVGAAGHVSGKCAPQNHSPESTRDGAPD